MAYWFFDTAGIGSVIVVVVAVSVLVTYIRMLRWIQSTPPSAQELPTEAKSADAQAQ